MTAHAISLSGLSVFVGMPTHRPLPPETVASLLTTQEACWKAGIRLNLTIEKGSSVVEAARTKVAHSFLQTNCNRLFWIDSDMSWTADGFVRLVALSTKMDVVGAAYRAKRDPPAYMVGKPETMRFETNEFGCIEWTGLGLGFTCVHRKVIEALAADAPRLKFPDIEGEAAHIFHHGVDENGNFSGEDMQFFADCRAKGFKVWIDPSIELGHIGDKTYSGSFATHLNELTAAPSD